MNSSIAHPACKIRRLLLLIAVVLVLGGAGMAVRASPLAVSAGQSWPVSLPPQSVLLYEDRDADMSLTDMVTLIQRHPDRFKPWDAAELPASSRSAWWFKIDLENDGRQALDLRLVLSHSVRGRIDYYVWQDEQWRHTAMGAEVPLDPRTSHTARRQALPLAVGPQERVTVIARLASDSVLAVGPRLYDHLAYASAESRAAVSDGILLGGLLVLAWGALLIALMSRSLTFGLMALLCVVIVLYEASHRGYAKLFLWPQASEWALRGTPFLGFCSIALALAFILSIARLGGVRLPARRLILLAIILDTMAALGALSGYIYWTTQFAPIALALYGVCALTCAITLLRASVPSSRVMILAGVFIASHTLLRVGEWTGTLPGFVADLGLDAPGSNPALALARMAINIAVMTAWVTIIAKQRRDAQNELIRMREQERDRLKEQVAIQTEALNRSLQYANEENRRKTETLSYVGHDLRAPLSTIVGYARLLAASSTPGQKAHIEAIERSAGYQLSLIDEIVDYARHEQPAPLDIRPGPVRLRELLDNIAQHALALSRQQNNRLEIHGETPLPAIIETDSKRLQQVLLNLISNAAKFTRDGSIRLTVRARRTQERTELEFQVQDSGPGIDPAQQDSIFDAYRQIEARPGSAGLGLHIARRIIQNLNGVIALDSLPGKGSCFGFTVPVGFLTNDTVLIDDIISVPRGDGGAEALFEARHIPPVESRVDLAKYAREGQLSSIEDWLDRQAGAHPGCAPFFRVVQQALETLDFDRIETLALANTE